MKIKTYRGVLAKVNDAVGRGNVVKHEPTEENTLGQSGFHTLADDVMDIMESQKTPGDRYRALAGFFQQLDEFQRQGTQEYCVTCLGVGDKCRCE